MRRGEGSKAQASTRIFTFGNPPRPFPAAIPRRQKFQKVGRGLGTNAQRAGSLLPPATAPPPPPPLPDLPSPVLAHSAPRAPSPPHSNADRPPPARRGPCGEGGNRRSRLSARCGRAGGHSGVREPPSAATFGLQGGRVRVAAAHPPRQSFHLLQGREGGWWRTPGSDPEKPGSCPVSGHRRRCPNFPSHDIPAPGKRQVSGHRPKP